MPPKTPTTSGFAKKTTDIKAYQAEYRKLHPKNKADANEYMKEYISKAEDIICPICLGHYKSYAKYKHDKTQKHLKALIGLKEAEEAKLKAEQERLQEEALAKAEAERQLEEEKAKAKAKPKSKPTPAPRKPKTEKPESLKVLEEYASSDDETKPPAPTTSGIVFKLQSTKINSTEVAEFIQKHFEASVDPGRSPDNKTPRLNKNASLWKKVSEKLDSKTFKYLGEHFDELVKSAYDKPSSQSDFAQMLKQVIVHFTKIPKPVLEQITEYIRTLKQAHKSKQK